MVWWICGGLVLVALIVLAVMLFDLRGRTTRFDAALKSAQTQTAPAFGLVRTLADVKAPSLRPAPVRKLIVGQDSPVSDLG